jgi:hypothetical protein
MSINTLVSNSNVIASLNSPSVLTSLQSNITPYSVQSSAVSALSASPLVYLSQVVVPTVGITQHLIQADFTFVGTLGTNNDITAYITVNGVQQSLSFVQTTSGASHKQTISCSLLYSSVGFTAFTVGLVAVAPLAGVGSTVQGIMSILANV